MRFTNSLFTLLTSLCVVLVFVFALNLTTGSSVNAGSSPQVASQTSDEDFDPVHEDDEEEEEWQDEDDDEEDDEGEEDGHDEDGEDEEEEWDEEEEEWEDGEFFEREAIELEMQRLGQEADLGRLELLHRMKEIAEDDDLMASFAIMHVSEFMEPEEVAEVLEELRETEGMTLTVHNLIKLKLVEVYSAEDEGDKALEVLKSIVAPKK